MSASIRERIVAAAVEALRPAAQAVGAKLYRSPAVALTREQAPALVVFPESDAVTERANDRVSRELTLRIVALTRVLLPGVPDSEADRLIAAAHTALFADPTFGGLALGLAELETEWDVEDADATAASLAARYRITYRTLQSDLTQAG